MTNEQLSKTLIKNFTRADFDILTWNWFSGLRLEDNNVSRGVDRSPET